jgi:hypothetical protein
MKPRAPISSRSSDRFRPALHPKRAFCNRALLRAQSIRCTERDPKKGRTTKNADAFPQENADRFALTNGSRVALDRFTRNAMNKKDFPELNDESLDNVSGGLHLARYSVPGATGLNPGFYSNLGPPPNYHGPTGYNGGQHDPGFFDPGGFLSQNAGLIGGAVGLAASFFNQGGQQQGHPQQPRYTPPQNGGQNFGNAVQFSAQAIQAIDGQHAAVAQGFVSTSRGSMSTSQAANTMAAQTHGGVVYGGDLNRDGVIDAGDFLHGRNVSEQQAAALVGNILDRLHNLGGQPTGFPPQNRPNMPRPPSMTPNVPHLPSIPGIPGLSGAQPHVSVPGRPSTTTPHTTTPSTTTPSSTSSSTADPTDPGSQTVDSKINEMVPAPDYNPEVPRELQPPAGDVPPLPLDDPRMDSFVTDQINRSVPAPEYPTAPPDFGPPNPAPSFEPPAVFEQPEQPTFDSPSGFDTGGAFDFVG